MPKFLWKNPIALNKKSAKFLEFIMRTIVFVFVVYFSFSDLSMFIIKFLEISQNYKILAINLLYLSLVLIWFFIAYMINFKILLLVLFLVIFQNFKAIDV